MLTRRLRLHPGNRRPGLKEKGPERLLQRHTSSLLKIQRQLDLGQGLQRQGSMEARRLRQRRARCQMQIVQQASMGNDITTAQNFLISHFVQPSSPPRSSLSAPSSSLCFSNRFKRVPKRLTSYRQNVVLPVGSVHKMIHSRTMMRTFCCSNALPLVRIRPHVLLQHVADLVRILNTSAPLSDACIGCKDAEERTIQDMLDYLIVEIEKEAAGDAVGRAAAEQVSVDVTSNS